MSSFPLASFVTDADFKAVLYIISFGLFIYGLSGLTGPTTAVRGNRIAAVGMAVAVVATLSTAARIAVMVALLSWPAASTTLISSTNAALSDALAVKSL